MDRHLAATRPIIRSATPHLAAAFVERIERSDGLAPCERAALEATIVRVEERPARSVLATARDPLQHSMLLLDGVVARQVPPATGRRRILALQLPGDFVDLHGFVLKSLDHDIYALSPVTLAIASHEALTRLTREHPHLARMLWFATAVDASIHREWIASLSRGAEGRVAHLICELRLRLEVVGRADRGGFDLPITQVDIADATSLTAVHVNRTLRRLRERGIMELKGGRISIADLDALVAIAGFDPAYLFLNRQAR